MSKTALLIGATGLVGQSLLRQLLASSEYTTVKTIVRRSMNVQHPKLQEQVVDFNFLTNADFAADHVFCTLGTTIKTAGSREAFRTVDYEYPLITAKQALEQGAILFAIVTSLGASSNSMFFYSRVKGDLENDLKKLGYPHLGIFQPSMLLGDRTEHRTGEGAAQVVMGWLDFLTPRQYKGIHVNKVAAAMLRYAQKPPAGVTVVQSGEMQG